MALPPPRHLCKARLVLVASAVFMLYLCLHGITNLSRLPAQTASRDDDPVPVSSPGLDFGHIADTATTTTSASSSDDTFVFFRDLVQALVAARPQTAETVVIPEPVSDFDMRPNPALDDERPRIDKTYLADDVRQALRDAHTAFLPQARALGQRVPFRAPPPLPERGWLGRRDRRDRRDRSQQKTLSPPPASRGIVMTASRARLGVALTSLLMLRRTGSQLPVQLFLDASTDLCRRVLPALGAECRVLDPAWTARPEPSSAHALALLLADFQEVLLLDAASWPLRRPDDVFDAEPFRAHGLVTWPDRWLSTAAPALYGPDGVLAGLADPPLALRRSSAPGLLLCDKARHGATLVLAAYYSWYGPDFYFPLLSQGAPGGHTDKDTFLHAALVLGASVYDVHTPGGVLGRENADGSRVDATIHHADPVSDAVSSSASKSYVPPALFLHNLVEIDLQHLGASLQPVLARNASGELSRLWQPTDQSASFEAAPGYDVERVFWDTVASAACPPSIPPSEACNDLKAFRAAVFP